MKQTCQHMNVKMAKIKVHDEHNTPISVIHNLEDKTMVVLSPDRNKPFKCKTILLFSPPDWELTERGL